MVVFENDEYNERPRTLFCLEAKKEGKGNRLQMAAEKTKEQPDPVTGGLAVLCS